MFKKKLKDGYNAQNPVKSNNMSHRGRGWSQVRPDRHVRPKGLRGRAIGMYYRDKALAKGQQKKKAYVINLNVPPAVVTALKKNIKYILNVATKENIKISSLEKLNMLSKNEHTMTTDIHASCDTIPDTVALKNIEKDRDQSISSMTDEPDGRFLKSQEAGPPKDLIEIKTEPIDNDKKNNTADQSIPSTSQGNNTNTSVTPHDIIDPNDDIIKIKAELIDDDSSLDDCQQSFVAPSKKIKQENQSQPSTSYVDTENTFVTPKNFMEIKAEPIYDVDDDDDDDVSSLDNRQLSLRGSGDYKYGYEDIITGTFNEKLEESLAKGVSITMKTPEIENMNVALNIEYQDLIERNDYKKFKKFRETLPAFKKTQDLLNVLEKNQVVVISGETGCGKSTQVPQIILDDAIVNNRGANIKIFVTQPRRIAASSLAMRVAEERGERMGTSVGYAVRLEKVEARPRGSIMFCTTGILLADLEVNQGLTGYSHIILDEVHERDCHIDLSMCMLKRVLQRRKDLKLILMSATIDAEALTAYFDNCPMLHIEGKAFPVQDLYLEDVLQMTKYQLPESDYQSGGRKRTRKHMVKLKRKACKDMEKEMQFKAQIGPWLNSIKSKLDRTVFETLQNPKIEELDMYLIYELLRHLCSFSDPGAILVFLPGISEITKLIRLMNDSKLFPTWKCAIYPLHSKLPSLEQRKIFERPPDKIRKIIIATNIAETSITIDDIVYVVDCGRIKYSGLNVEENVSTLKTEWVSQANLRQRRGRAGRCQPGVCYHLVTSYRASLLEERLLPEIQRSNLLEPVLCIKRLRLGKAAEALNQTPSPPAVTTVEWAIKHLRQCGALDESETLTPLGWHLARLPVHPAAGKLLLLGALFGCLDRAASVAAVWGFKDPFQMVLGKENDLERSKRRLASGEPSDHVAISEAIVQWERCSKSRKRQFAYDNFLSMNTLELLSEMKNQLGNNLRQMGFLASGDIRSKWENRNEKNMSLFKALVAAALYPNVANCRWIGVRSYKRPTMLKPIIPGEAVKIHPSSVMSVCNLRGGGVLEPAAVCPEARWLVYWLKQKSSDLYLLEITVVYTLPLLFFGQLTIVVPDEDTDPDKFVISIGAMNVACHKSTMKLLFRMRSLLDQVLASKIMANSSHGTQHSTFDDAVLNGITALITAEDECIGEYDTGSDTSEY